MSVRREQRPRNVPPPTLVPNGEEEEVTHYQCKVRRGSGQERRRKWREDAERSEVCSTTVCKTERERERESLTSYTFELRWSCHM